MGVLFLQYPPCTTCKRAKAWLDERGVDYEARNIKEENPTVEELKAWHQKSGLPLKRFFNTSGLAYKALGLKDRLPTMTEEEQYQLLASDGMLVKRPLAIGEDFVLVGFRQEQWQERLRLPPAQKEREACERCPRELLPLMWRRPTRSMTA